MVATHAMSDRQADVELRTHVRDLLVTVGGYHDPIIIKAERDGDSRVVALFTIWGIDGRRHGRTMFLEDTGELVVVDGFVW